MSPGTYDEGLGIDSEIIDYIKQSHLVQSRISPSKVYLVQQNQLAAEHTGSGASGGVVIQSGDYLGINPYNVQIWASGSAASFPDLRLWVNEGVGAVTVFIDAVKAQRVASDLDLIASTDFAVVLDKQRPDKRVRIVFNQDISSKTVEYTYTSMSQDFDTETAMVDRQKPNTYGSKFGWTQYTTPSTDFYAINQVLVRLPLTPVDLERIASGESEMQSIDNCWMIDAPYVFEHDIFITAGVNEISERRYEIVNKQDSYIQTNLVSQRFSLLLLESSDGRYDIPVASGSA